MIHQHVIEIPTRGREARECTADVQAVVAASGIGTGTCHVFIQHTSASLMICENADPAVQRDLEAFMQRLVPDGDALFVHTAEGPDDMPAHVRSVLTASALTLPVSGGRCLLGTWQGIFLWEHRHRGQRRRLVITVAGDRQA